MKNILLFILFYFVSYTSFAQKSIHLELATNISRISGPEQLDTVKPIISPAGYLYMEIPFGDFNSYFIGFGYSMQGSNMSESLPSGVFDYFIVKEKIGYIRFPFGFSWHTANKHLNFYYLLGGSMGFLAYNKRQVIPIVNGYPADIGDIYDLTLNIADIELMASAGFTFNKFIFHIDYSVGITGVYKGKNAFAMRNEMLSLSIGYVANIRKKRRF